MRVQVPSSSPLHRSHRGRDARLFDIDAIQGALFSTPGVRAKLVEDYGLPADPATPQDLADHLVSSFGQESLADPLRKEIANREVFRAAVLALGSNSRKWSTFVKGRPRLEELLSGWDPSTSQHLDPAQLREYFPGQTRGSDTEAVVKWAKLLACDANPYQGFIQEVVDLVQQEAAQTLQGKLIQEELILCAVAFLANPSARGMGRGRRAPSLRPRSEWKLPGMFYVLGIEFMRNLGWRAFKPDRHIRRLLRRWAPEVVRASGPRASELAGLIRSNPTPDLIEYFTFCLAGMRLTPPEVHPTRADNLVWALAAYVEKKNKESSTVYLRA